MAVQAHYSNAFAPGIQINNRDLSIALKDHQHIGRPNGLVVSDLMHNVSGTRKRSRDEPETAAIQQFQFPIQFKIPKTQSIQASSRQSQHEMEIDAMIKLHNAKLRSDLGEMQSRHSREMIKIYENQAAKKIAQKEAEIVTLRRKQSELESRLNQIAAENRIMFAIARNSEAVVAGLRASLDQALRGKAAAGECQGEGAQAEDAASCCYEGDSEDRKEMKRSCRVCGGRDVSVLLLPCRHLCLCLECEPGADTCPICNERKNVGLQVFMD